jgi:subtilisin family serine protease
MSHHARVRLPRLDRLRSIEAAHGSAREAELRHRDLTRLTVTLTVALAIGLAIIARGTGAVPSLVAHTAPATRPTTVAALPADTDFLLASPATGTAPALAASLATLGYQTETISPLLPDVRVRVPAGTPPAALAQRLAATGLLSGIEADGRVHADRIPDDALFAAQEPYLDVIRAPQAWDLHPSAATVTIAVVDTGVDVAHPDLAARVLRNPFEVLDGRDDDQNGCIDDLYGCTFVSPAAADPSCGYTQPAPRSGAYDDEGHGTFVAGIAAATGNNEAGVAGIAWDAHILPVKVLDCTATGRISDAAAGILYAARAGARVIVLAFGSATDTRVLRDAVAEATDHYGALVVASVGNEATDRVQYPAAYRGVLAVAGSGAVADNGAVDYRHAAVFTNTGPEVGIFAPALRLTAPVPAAMCGRNGWNCIDGPYARASGTSFAAPLAAGAVALLLGSDRTLSPTLAAAMVRASAQPLGGDARQRLLDVQALLLRPTYSASAAGTSSVDATNPPVGPVDDRSR